MFRPLLFYLYFFYGLFKYVREPGKDGIKGGKATMTAGLIALFIEVSLYGILAFLQTNLGVQGNSQTLPAPTVPTYSGQ